MTLIIYLLVIINRRPARKILMKLPFLLLSPFLITLLTIGTSASLPFHLSFYAFISSLILALCTLWAMWVWRLNFWQAFPCVCMAGTLQMAATATTPLLFSVFPSETFLQYATLLLLFLSLVCASTILLKRIRFGVYFQLLMEDKARLRQTALLIFALEITIETFTILHRGIMAPYLILYYTLLIVLVALMTGLIVHLAKGFDTDRRIQAQQDIIAQQQLYEQNLEDIRREVRSFRHDYKNLLASLSEQAREGELDSLHLSLAKLDADFDRRLGEKIQISVQIGNLQIPQVRSLLLNKLTVMREKGVACRLEALKPVTQADMDVWDFLRCLGILIDNAMEAALETEEPWVEIVMLQREGTLGLRIVNPYATPVSPENMWTEGWSTKGAGRGLGLSGYLRILENYPHAVSSTSWKGSLFVQELTIGKEI